MMEHFKLLENAREAAYCLLFSVGELKCYAADLLTLAGLVLLSVIPSCNPAFPPLMGAMG